MNEVQNYKLQLQVTVKTEFILLKNETLLELTKGI